MIEASNHVLETLPPRVPARGPGASAAQPVETPPATVEGESSKEFRLFGKDGFDFYDLLDVINPLQHIPVISTVYRRMTGDELSPAARVAGATLFGGPIGAALAVADSVVEYETGKDTGANVYAAMFGNGGPIPEAGTMMAQAAPNAAQWRDPDTMSDQDYFAMQAAIAGGTKGGGSARAAFVASQAPDLGALADFNVTAGQKVALVTNQAPVKLEPTSPAQPMPAQPMLAQPWVDPDKIPQTVAAKPAAQPAEFAALAADAKPAVKTEAMAQAIAASRAALRTQGMAEETERPGAPQAATSKANNIDVERPMPTDAAKAQAINALAAMPTSQTTAAVAELAQSTPRNAPRHHMAPPASDIPRGASASLARGAAKAYANSMASRRTPEQIESAKAAEARAQAIMAANANGTPLATPVAASKVEKAAAKSAASTQNAGANVQNANAQNDWMLESMQRAMAKYEASAKLRNAANDPTNSAAIVH